MVDKDGWHFTKNGKYSGKSGYQLERVYPDKAKPPEFYGPTVDSLKAFYWNVRCPLKIRHFLWQMVSGCIAVKKNLQARGIRGDICCARCGAEEESINHVFFECPPAQQVWALSKIPLNPVYFPTSSLFTNMDHLFWRVLPKMKDHHFAWLLWYIWKGRNNKVFSNLDIDPRETIKLAETESTLWAEAQVLKTKQLTQQGEGLHRQLRVGRWCFINGSWKDKEPYSGQGWYSTLEGFQEEWPAFESYRHDITILKTSFISSEIIHVPRTENKKADSLARCARKQSSFVVHMDVELPVWFAESI
ncbi:uncharacterized protein LOC125591851 [Brassica napus]|uniref:uncharacterized protein LOC125591851 n=1 Tax=Brassica napus TaxID=3708 RepID=UPI0020795509|nr:uncharacterized protein LOC125591851 [Brassica napus]